MLPRDAGEFLVFRCIPDPGRPDPVFLRDSEGHMLPVFPEFRSV